MADEVERYVISRAASGDASGDSRHTPVADLVDDVQGVRVVGALDDSTALVEMSDDARVRVEREHPQLVVEPNLYYGLLASRRHRAA